MGITPRTAAALAIAALPTRARMREDAAGVPEWFGPFAYYFHDHLFEADLSVEKAKAESGYRDNSASSQFDDHLGATAWDYVIDRRLEVALRLLAEHEISVGQTFLAIGFENDQTFRRAFKKRYGFPP
ncbi:MAG: helix-turn-helix domain-containing protein, partial [Phycisphaeraceae bacterium]|nr:helix-turn-helix domain-containing protein [Phycisphaeraceae bacterium]